MQILRYTNFINEQNQENTAAYDDMKNEIRELIEKSLKTSDKKTFEDFVSAYLRNPEETQIEGLINDADIYEFYIKYRNNIDEILSRLKFYEEKPSEKDAFSLYDFVVKGTKEAIKEVIEMLKD